MLQKTEHRVLKGQQQITENSTFENERLSKPFNLKLNIPDTDALKTMADLINGSNYANDLTKHANQFIDKK